MTERLAYLHKKCPFCNSKDVFNADDILIKKVKNSTVLSGCGTCSRLWGNFTK